MDLEKHENMGGIRGEFKKAWREVSRLVEIFPTCCPILTYPFDLLKFIPLGLRHVQAATKKAYSSTRYDIS